MLQTNFSMNEQIEKMQREIASGVQCYWSKEQLLALLDELKTHTQQQTQTKLF
jgi:hypothetical protein